jgi:hypothetical protein
MLRCRLPPASPLQVYKALFDGVQVVAAKVLTGLTDERVFQSFVDEVGGLLPPWPACLRRPCCLSLNSSNQRCALFLCLLCQQPAAQEEARGSFSIFPCCACSPAPQAAILRDMRDKNIVQLVGICMGSEEEGQPDEAMMVCGRVGGWAGGQPAG